ncbi:hypothetical protein M4951_00645 [Blastopirellula sp. J2-11]|uniref:hypothetical protein n=1 Tax=Blastopirellula sp. J2-11 TaxID=2943192 RepID=UPI0021C6B1B9|nr:hypothetical protein [Blastopirellula sp. J2-11]UUO06836.1 hypothetical protein M4951_00645 [Blastopirellula sp. J2-11]
MSQFAYDAESTLAVQKRAAAPWRTPAFVLFYGAAIVALIAILACWPNSHVILLSSGLFSFVWRVAVPVIAAFVAIGCYLLVMAPRRCWATLLILAVSHGMVGGIAYWILWRDNPGMANSLFGQIAIVFWLVLAILSVALAYWNRRRCWRFQRISSDEPASPPRMSLPMSPVDYLFLAAILVAMGMFQKWASGPMAEALPASIVVITILAGMVRIGLAPARRGFSPTALIITGLICLAAACLCGWYFYPRQITLLFVMLGIPITLWSGVLLALRGDGYRLVRDYSVIADKDPIAEPDPLA